MTWTTLAAKHAARFRAAIAACGCPRLDKTFGPLWCAACVDRDQVAHELERLDRVLVAVRDDDAWDDEVPA